MKKILFLVLSFFIDIKFIHAQDTFSIVAIDSITGEVGSAGASCLDLYNYSYNTNDFISELFPGIGAINSQAAYLPANQANARNRMNAGDSPSQIINWLTSNDVGGAPQDRQYGIVRLINGSPKSAAHTGSNCLNYKSHRVGVNYSIQGNILLGSQVLDSMEARFKREPGDLACKLMAAMQGAKMVGADSRCSSYGTSSLFAFLKVSQPNDAFGSPSFLISLRTHSYDGIEPINELQKQFNNARGCNTVNTNAMTNELDNEVVIYPNPAGNTLKIKMSNQIVFNGVFSIKDVLGRKIIEEQFITEKTVDISKWESGIYLLELWNGETRITKKIIKQ